MGTVATENNDCVSRCLEEPSCIATNYYYHIYSYYCEMYSIVYYLDEHEPYTATEISCCYKDSTSSTTVI